MSYGRLVVGGMSFPIVGVELAGGRMWLIASRHGPFTLKGGPVTVFGSDGLGVCQGADMQSRVVEEGQRLDLRLEMRIGQVDDE